MTPDFLLPTRRSFLGWTAAIAGCALLTRPALAVPEKPRLVTMVDIGEPGASRWVIVHGKDEYGRPFTEKLDMRRWKVVT